MNFASAPPTRSRVRAKNWSSPRSALLTLVGSAGLAGLVGLVGLVGCAANPQAEPAAMRSVETSAEKIAAGRALFATCAACHDIDGSGRAGAGPRLISDSLLAASSDSFLMNTIKNGRPGTTMIGWGVMYNDDQIATLVAYLRSLNPVLPASLDESPLKGNASDGEPIFTAVCSSCHGRSGGGYQESANGTGIGRKAFLEGASDGFLRYLIRNGKSGTAMRAFSSQGTAMAVMDLTDEQVDGVIAYLRMNAW